MRKIAKSKGVALISVLLVLMSLMVLTMGFAAFTTSDHVRSKAYQSQVITFYLAQAGLEYVHYLITHNMLVFPIGTKTSGTPYTDTSVPGQHYLHYGEASNAYLNHDNNNPGEEHLVISSLSWGDTDDNLVHWILDNNDMCGTFEIKVKERDDDNSGDLNSRVLYVKSVGKVREIKPGHNPLTESYTNDANFPVRAQRTLYTRIPYQENADMDLQYDSGGGDEDVFYKIMSDGWYEKFR